MIDESAKKKPHEPKLMGLDVAGRTGLEPAASGVTGRRYKQLNYHPTKEHGQNRIRTCNQRRVKPMLSH